MAPHFDKLREQGIEVTTLDVQANRKLADDFGIRSIPTLFLYEGDFMLKKHIGAMTPDQLRDFIA